MADQEYFIPGYGFVNIPDADTRGYFIPGDGFLSGGGGEPPEPPDESPGLFFANG